MTGVLVGIGAFAAVFVAHLAFSHIVQMNRKERALLAFMIAGGLIYTVAFVVVESGSVNSVAPVLEYVAGGCAFAFFGLGYVEFWSLIERSFSARLLIDCARAGSAGLSAVEIANAYAGGRGLDWMFDKRKDGLIGSGMVMLGQTGYVLSPRGKVLAKVLHGFRLIFRMV